MNPGSVLVVDDSRAMNLLLCTQLLELNNVSVESAASLQEAKKLLARDAGRFFVAILDLNLPDAPNGEIVDLVQRQGIPAIVLTGNLNDEVREQMLQRELVDYVLKHNTSEIEYVIRQVMLLRDNHLRKVLVVEDSSAFRLYLKSLLSIHRFQLLEAEHGRQALELLKANPDIQLIITDYNMPEMNGAELIEQIRRTHGREDLAVIGLSSSSNHRTSAGLLKAGANDFITKPFEVEEFYCRVNLNVEMISKVRKIRDASTRDFLTGVHNRQHLFELGEPLYASAKQENIPLAAAMIDVDKFKDINDTFGHLGGDTALVAMANGLQGALRETDILARFGGEEFVCLAICTDEAAALETFERVRRAIEALRIPVKNGVLTLTVSIGVTLDLSESLGGMLAIADAALYQAKTGGRNRVVYK